MALDEALFERLHRWLTRRVRRAPTAVLARRVTFAELERRLGIVASLLAGRTMEVRASQDHGAVLGDRLFVPAAIHWAPGREDNVSAYLLRIALGVAASAIGARRSTHRDPELRSIATLCRAPQVVAHATSAWPGMRALFQRLASLRLSASEPRMRRTNHPALVALERVRLGEAIEVATRDLDAAAVQFVRKAADQRTDELDDELDAVLAAWRRLPESRRRERFDLTFWGDLLADRESSAGRDASPSTPPESRDALPTGTERAAPPRRDVERVELQEDQDESPLIHVFEKVKTAEEHQGGRRELDGSDELAAHLDALDELDLRQVLRSRKPTASVYRADLQFDGASAALDDASPETVAIQYDEWDEQARRYRDGWCSVFVGTPDPAEPAQASAAVRAVRSRHARAIRKLRGEFARIERTRAIHRRQLKGNDIDLDAVIDRHAALRAARQHGGRVDDERLYTDRRPGRHDLATLVLLDASLSTDSFVENRRVLDVARESVIVLGEVLRDVRIRVGVAAFFSNARRDCRFQVVKAFDESWHTGYGRLLGIRPTGYTRIGPALRHATELLGASGCRRKLLVLVSDGKPTDYDRYEGRYGIADIRQALRESRRDGVRTIALTVDARAKGHLPQMFGAGGFRLLRHPGELPDALARLHERVMR